MIKFKITLTIFLLSLVFIGCEDRSDLTEPAATETGTANFSKFVSLGNCLTAGYQSSALYESAQKYSFGKMIANQVGVDYVQPTVSDPGIGGRIDVATVSPFTTKTQAADAGTPTNLTFQGAYNNFGIPGALLPDLLQAKDGASALDKTNPFFNIVLRQQGTTALEQAIAAQPTIATLWIGNNDILGYATTGGVLPHTPIAFFGPLYGHLCGALAQANIPVILANIPDVKSIPFFTTVGPGVGLAIQPAMKAGLAMGLFYQKSGEVVATGLADTNALWTNQILLTLRSSSYASLIGQPTDKFYVDNGITPPPGIDVSQPFGLHPQNPFPDIFVLDPDEITEVETVTSSFNASIKSIAIDNGFHLVDLNSFFANVAKNKLVVEGVEYTTEFVSGGLFSLDGVHPTSQGYAIIANEFIKVINDKFSAKIPEISVSTIPGSLELGKKVSFNKFGLPIFESGTFDSVYY